MFLIKSLAVLVILSGMLGCDTNQKAHSTPLETKGQIKIDSKNTTQLFSGLSWVISEGEKYEWKSEDSGDIVAIKILKIDGDKIQLWIRRPESEPSECPMPTMNQYLPYLVKISKEIIEIDKSALPVVIAANDTLGTLEPLIVDTSEENFKWEWLPYKKFWQSGTKTYEDSYYYVVAVRPNPQHKIPDIGYAGASIHSSGWGDIHWYRSRYIPKDTSR